MIRRVETTENLKTAQQSKFMLAGPNRLGFACISNFIRPFGGDGERVGGGGNVYLAANMPG